MTKRLSHIAPWQAGKLFALIYFFFSLLLVIPMAILSALVPMPTAPGHRLGAGFIILLPFSLRVGWTDIRPLRLLDIQHGGEACWRLTGIGDGRC